tara:strand:+ start:197 stop:658 length:462 start_codon:yes stop_codon:yes gene_type:complete
MSDYNRSIIYKLECNETGNVYFGATTEPINRRISKHKCRKSCTCRDIITKNNFKVVELENHATDQITKEFLLERERSYILNFNCVNKIIPLQTKREYYEKNKHYLNKKNRWWKQKKRCEAVLNTFIFRHLNKQKMKENNNPPSFFNFVKIKYN